jgi:hypothetical protein
MESLASAVLVTGSGSRMSRSVGVPPPADGCPSLCEAGELLLADWLPSDDSGEPLAGLCAPVFGEPELWDGDPEGGGLLDEGLPDEPEGGGLLDEGLPDELEGGGLEAGGELLGIDGGVGILMLGMVSQAANIKVVPVITSILKTSSCLRIKASIYPMEFKLRSCKPEIQYLSMTVKRQYLFQNDCFYTSTKYFVYHTPDRVGG